MSTGDDIQGTHPLDLLSRSEYDPVVVSVGSSNNIHATLLIYNNNDPVNGYYISKSDGSLTIKRNPYLLDQNSPNVIIGETSKPHDFNVYGSISMSGSIVIDSDRNMYIGNSIEVMNADPGDMLSVKYDGSYRHGIGQYNGGIVRVFANRDIANNTFSVRISSPTDEITNGSAGFIDHVTVLTKNGNVGIGTDNPIYKLDVVGAVKITGAYIGNGALLTNLNADNVTSGILAVARGGTGVATLAANKVLVGNGTGAVLTPTNLHWDNANSRLGIGLGLNAPGYALDVVGDMNITGTYRGNGSSLTNLNIGNVTSGTLSVANGGTGVATLAANKVLIGNGTGTVLTPTNLHWDNANSRLGVGTAAPTAYLHVYCGGGTMTNTSAFPVFISADTKLKTNNVNDIFAGDPGQGQLMITGATDQTKRLALMYDTTNNIALIQGVHVGSSSIPLCLNAAGGNVGIGNTAPASTLDVAGAISVNGTTMIDTNKSIFLSATSWTTGVIRLNSSSVGASTSADYFIGRGWNLSGSDYKDSIVINCADTVANAGFHVMSSGAVSRMFVNTNNGNVGINNTAPAAKLDVNGSCRISCVNTIWNSSVDNDNFTGLRLVSNKSGNTPWTMGLGVDVNTGYGFIAGAGNSAIQRLLINPRGGNVGIGNTQQPATALDVAGTVKATSYATPTPREIYQNDIGTTPVGAPVYGEGIVGSWNNVNSVTINLLNAFPNVFAQGSITVGVLLHVTTGTGTVGISGIYNLVRVNNISWSVSTVNTIGTGINSVTASGNIITLGLSAANYGHAWARVICHA